MFTERGKTFHNISVWLGVHSKMMGAAARLPGFSLALGIESCCEVDDLSCLGTLEKCRRLARLVDVLQERDM